MSTTTTQTIEETQKPEFAQLELVTALGPVYRLVSLNPPRDAAPEEVPVIDISGLYGDFTARKELAAKIGAACRSYGFFYIKNHGIPEEMIANAKLQALNFFRQPAELKDKASDRHSKFSNGWSALRSRRVSPGESAGKRFCHTTFSATILC